VTKQNTHSEHSDVDISVVEHSLASEDQAFLPSLETEGAAASPVLPPADMGSSPEEQPDRHTPQEEQNLASGEVNQNIQEEAPAKPAGESFAGTLFQDQPEIAIAGSGEESSAVEAALESPIVDALVVEEEVRPFTDFIEEFRQAETRFNSSLQAYEAESLSLLTTTAEEVASGSAADSATEANTFNDAGGQFIAPAEVPASQEEEQVPIPTAEQEGETQLPGESPAIQTDTATSAGHPVSPLLRPPSRLRPQRHVGGRHREGPSEESTARTEAETPAQEAKVEPAVTEPASVEEQPRPARRYRFDRPAASTTTAPGGPSLAATPTSPSQAQSRPEDNKDVPGRVITPVPPVSPRLDNGQTSEKEAQTVPEAQQPIGRGQLPEQGAPKPAVQEPPLVETNTAPVTAPTQEHERRRRHGQDRQHGKEQPVSTPAPTVPGTPAATAAEAVANITEPVTSQQVEVNPEDLPPLEYSELQKASTRRRRRRHPGSPAASAPASTTPIAARAATPEVPPVSQAPEQTPPVATPGTPANAAAPASPYTITSGYTVNQMNRGHDGSSPFMGPEPSPARGSSAAQHVRSIRTDAQRTPVYPVRTTEATSASVHQLANIVSQAIQTQTDRLAAELRRANQTPTNISVTMPPFPSNERVGVFVDVANLLYSARTLRMTVDFGKLLDFLRGDRRLIRAHAYCPTSPQHGDEQMFLQAVKGLGYRITTKNYKTFSSGAKKADLDLDLCMDVVRLVDGRAVDCVVLVSGDSDFMPMLDYCSDHGVRVEVAAFDEAMSATLRQSCDLFINLSMLEEIRA
jgi:uncharacterized LabA/DUF88 family protein